MKSFTVSAGLILLASLAAAQLEVPNVPECAMGCVGGAVLSSGCDVSNEEELIKCSCSNAAKINEDISKCMPETSCTDEEKSNVVTGLEEACKVAGSPVPSGSPSDSPSGSPSGSPTQRPSTSPTSGSDPASTSNAAPGSAIANAWSVLGAVGVVAGFMAGL